jgi:CheY-like chemotaxis protein
MSRIFVVEDDPDTCDVIALRLLIGGHDVVTTASAEEALDTAVAMAASCSPDLDALSHGW